MALFYFMTDYSRKPTHIAIIQKMGIAPGGHKAKKKG